MSMAFVPSVHVLNSRAFFAGGLCLRAQICRPILNREQRWALKPLKKQSRIRMGLIPFIPNWISLPVYLYGAYKFYSGFDNTSYQQSFRIPLSFAWPIFAIFSDRYRKNFFKALKGDDS